jgi:hypothetical protein
MTWALGLAAESQLVPAVAKDLADHDLDARRERDGQERSDHPEKRASKQDGDEHDEWLHVDGTRLDSRLDDVVLNLLVDDRPDCPNDRGRREIDERGDDSHQDGGESRADERDEIEQTDKDRERNAEKRPR